MALTKEQFDALHARWAEEAAERQQARDEHGRWVAETQAAREARARGDLPPIDLSAVPSWASIFGQSEARRQEALAEAERARVTALSPHDIWLTTLSLQEQERVRTWERINRMQYPMPSSVVDDIAATKRLYEYEAAVQAQAQQTP